MEACVESVFPQWIISVFSRSRATTGPSLSRPSETVHESLPRFVHVSLDSFFAAVEQQRNPKLQGKPVVVGRTTALSASQEAILAGVQPNISIDDALRICPALVVVNGQFPLYAEYVERVRGLLARRFATVEAGAQDDFYLDFAGRLQPLNEFRASLLRLQLEILEETGLSVSIGAGSTRAIAAVASRIEGPRGLHLVAPGIEREFLEQVPAKLLPGVNSRRAAELAASEVATIGALARVPRAVLERGFGKFTGCELWNHARGRDVAPISLHAKRQALSQQLTIEGGTRDSEELKRAVSYLCERIAIELNRSCQEASRISINIRYTDDYCARQSVGIEPYETGFQNHALRLFQNLFTRPVGVERVTLSVVPKPAPVRVPVKNAVPEALSAAVNQ